ncbi:hypothetical protein IAI10_16990 [Clostridium sp. 19966]|uniref:hypothetical protein n=1 Tax=Clostridium sp. 19966 TaxID=2768166 RepID=UPI0028DF6D05|nr:hypothetical protein [Clostridium sp. 19966]MDT8718365.1 hypothetical protein [Clostridium sp. 19966]
MRYIFFLFIMINYYYLGYFPKGAFKKQVKYLNGFYLGENEETKEDFIYLTEKEMASFIEAASEKIQDILN